MVLTIDKILKGEYKLDEIWELDYDRIRTILRARIEEIERMDKAPPDVWLELRTLSTQMNKLSELYLGKTELTCSMCGKGASWNTPYLKGNDIHSVILCDSCAGADRSGSILHGIEQRRKWNGDLEYDRNPHYRMNGHTLVFYMNTSGGWTNGQYKGSHVTVHKPNWSINAWTSDGAAFPLVGSEPIVAIRSPELILGIMEETINMSMFRCTSCSKTLKVEDLGGRPLFAGKVCKPCWQKHLEALESQKKLGHVCRMCGEPYGNCCC
jgi:hypothetical protein